MVERPSELSALYQRRQRARRVVSRVLRDLHERQPIRSWNTILRSRPGRDVTVTGPFVPGQRKLSLPSTASDVFTDDADDLDVTSEIWMACSFSPLALGTSQVLGSKCNGSVSGGYEMRLNASNGVGFVRSSAATSTSSLNSPVPVPLIETGVRMAIGVHARMDGTICFADFYVSTDDGESWESFSSNSNVGDWTDNTLGLYLGSRPNGTADFLGEIWWFEVRDGDMNSEIVTRIDLTTADVGTTEVEDLQGHSWSIAGDAEII